MRMVLTLQIIFLILGKDGGLGGEGEGVRVGLGAGGEVGVGVKVGAEVGVGEGKFSEPGVP